MRGGGHGGQVYAVHAILAEAASPAYLHYQHRWEPDGPERFERGVLITAAVIAALSVVFALSARREARLRKQQRGPRDDGRSSG